MEICLEMSLIFDQPKMIKLQVEVMWVKESFAGFFNIAETPAQSNHENYQNMGTPLPLKRSHILIIPMIIRPTNVTYLLTYLLACCILLAGGSLV